MKNRFKEMSIGEEFECFASRKFEKGKSVESHNKTSACFHGFSESSFGEREDTFLVKKKKREPFLLFCAHVLLC
jgi:hypothetical protein